MSELTDVITASDPRSATARSMPFCRAATLDELLAECAGARPLPPRQRQPLRARARAVLPVRHPPLPPSAASPAPRRPAPIPFAGYVNLLKRRFEEAIDIFLAAQAERGPSAAISSALAAGYRALGFQTLADQVRRSVRSRARQPVDVPHRPSRRLSAAHPPRTARTGAPALPHPARNHARAHGPDPQRLERHLLPGHGFPRRRARAQRLHRPRACAARRMARRSRRWKPTSASSTSRCCASPASICRPPPTSPRIAEVFDFARDYLGLLKAAVIASGIVPPGMEGATPAAGRSAGAPDRQAGPRHRNRQQGQRHSQRLAPGRLHQPAGLPDRGLHARHRPDPRAHRRAGGARPPPGGRARHPGRMAGRLGRRLAGFRRRLARHQADPGRRGRRGRSGIRHQPRPPAARPSRSSTASEVSARDARRSCKRAWCWCTAAWRRTSARSWKWSPRNTCCARRPNGRAAGRPSAFSTKSLAHLQRGDIAAHRRAAPQRNFDGPIQTIIPWAGNLYTETLIRRVRARIRRRLLGLLDARRHVRRRHGFHLQPRAQGARRRSACRPS